MKVVYDSFGGRYADNPRAVYEALLRRDGEAHEHVWLVDPRHAESFPRPWPGRTRAVVVGSDEASAELGSADVVVCNRHTDVGAWEKKPGALYVQTWHGTPLKRIHRDAHDVPDEAEMASIDAEIARWDRLVTPSRAGTELLRAAFGYTGEVLETGYPRNDVLNAPDAGERRRRVREELGLAPGTTAVLYAPTWRDDEARAAGDVALALDVAEVREALGEDHVLLLRLHYFLSHRMPDMADDAVLDVSGYPDISDLYLAADVLVTDYSSALFDFAVTGKPILLYTYDLEHYRDRLRGFYLDLEAEAPGPLLHDQRELVAALQRLPEVAAEHADRYARFTQAYCALEDGHATERVLEHVWPR